MEIFTIGFTKKSAAEFFGRLRRAGIRRLLDVRLNNVSQLAGFAKRDDLAFFLREICGADYERDFLALMAERRIEARLDSRRFEVPTALLCSEDTAERCLVAEYLREKWPDVRITHL